MAQIIQETVTQEETVLNPVVAGQVVVKATSSQTIEYLIYFFFGLVEILLVFRLILKMTGASHNSSFVGFIYTVTGLFNLPFEGMFKKGFAPGIETTSVWEPATLVALVVYAVLAWGIVRLLRVLSGVKQPE